MVLKSIRQTEDDLRGIAGHYLAYPALLLPGIGSLVPCAASTHSLYRNLYPLAIPHGRVYSYPYPYPIAHTDAQPYLSRADTHFDGHPNRHTHWHAHGDRHDDSHRDPDGVAIPHNYGYTDAHGHSYGNPHCHGDPDPTTADSDRHPNSHAHTLADGYRDRHSDGHCGAYANQHRDPHGDAHQYSYI